MESLALWSCYWNHKLDDSLQILGGGLPRHGDHPGLNTKTSLAKLCAIQLQALVTEMTLLHTKCSYNKAGVWARTGTSKRTSSNTRASTWLRARRRADQGCRIRSCEARPPSHEQLLAWVKTLEALALLDTDTCP